MPPALGSATSVDDLKHSKLDNGTTELIAVLPVELMRVQLLPAAVRLKFNTFGWLGGLAPTVTT